MIELDYAALSSVPVTTEPFRHLLVRDFVPPTSLRQVLGDLPPISQRGSFPIEAVRLGPAARALTTELQGPRLREALAARFGLDLGDAPTMLTLRGWTTEREGHIHVDSVAKRVTVLLYLNQEAQAFGQHEGCLRLLHGPNDLEDYAVEVPPVDGTLLAFPNGADTWHGHKVFSGRRYSMQLNYMTTDERARSELRRHRLSALVKRLTRAA